MVSLGQRNANSFPMMSISPPPPKSIKALGLAGIDYSMGALRRNPQWIKQAHDLGLEVNVWTVDSEEDLKYFIEQGVDYITTNYPERLQALLKE